MSPPSEPLVRLALAEAELRLGWLEARIRAVFIAVLATQVLIAAWKAPRHFAF